MKFQTALFATLLLFPAALSAQSDDITEHLKTVEAHLRARDVSHWTPEKQSARKTTLDTLHRYHRHAKYPKNTDFRGARVPYFVDNEGTNCAVAELMEKGGFVAEVEKIAATENNFWLHEMTSPALKGWTEAAGISIQEAAWIQPTYEFCYETEFVKSPKSANCGDTIKLSVRDLDCQNTFGWRLFRNEELTDTKFPDSPEQSYTIPDSTLDGERFTFKVLTGYAEEYSGEISHTLIVACEGQAASPPKKEVPIEEPNPPKSETEDDIDQGCSSTRSQPAAWLILGALLMLASGRKRRVKTQ